MEVNLQNLLNTAKAEVKRKEALIAQLRKESVTNFVFRASQLTPYFFIGRTTYASGGSGCETSKNQEKETMIVSA